MQIKPKFILCIIVVLMIITIIIGCIYKNKETEQQIVHIDGVRKTKQDNIKVESTNKLEIEINKEVDTEEAVEFVKNEAIFNLTDYERWVVECIVMGESGGEPYKGQMLVAQCVLNACLKDNIQPSEVRIAYKYSGWKENPTESVKKAVSEVFDLGKKAVDEPILYFYAPFLCKSKWHESQTFVIEFGGHRFFKEK